MAGFPVDKHRVETSLFVNIHDETDDVDFPQDVQRLIEAVEKRPEWRVRFLMRRLSLWNKNDVIDGESYGVELDRRKWFLVE